MKKPLLFLLFILVFIIGYLFGNSGSNTEKSEAMPDNVVNNTNDQKNNLLAIKSSSTPRVISETKESLSNTNEKKASEQKNDIESETGSINQQDSESAGIVNQTKDIAMVYSGESVDGSWSYEREAKIRALFGSDDVLADGLLLSEVNCKSSTCRLKIENFDTNKENLSIMSLTETLYSVDWSADSNFKIEATDDPNSKVVFVADSTRN